MANLVSVVVAVYNGEKFLEPQIRSLQAQDHKDLEIILMDDKSTDSSLKIIEGLAAEDQRIQVHSNSGKLGFAANFLKGLLLSRGGLICFCDQDDVWQPDKVSILKKLIESDGRNMLAYSDLEVCDESLHTTQASFWKAAGIKPRAGDLKEKTLLRNLTPGCSMMFRGQVRDLLRQSPSNLPFLHDHLVFVLSSSLGRVDYSKKRLVKYRQHDRNNIGAFYPAVMDKNRFIQDILLKMEALQKMGVGGSSMDLEKIKNFFQAWKEGGLRLRSAYLDYYLFLRNDRWRDQWLGAIECLTPGVYHWLKHRLRP